MSRIVEAATIGGYSMLAVVVGVGVAAAPERAVLILGVGVSLMALVGVRRSIRKRMSQARSVDETPATAWLVALIPTVMAIGAQSQPASVACLGAIALLLALRRPALLTERRQWLPLALLVLAGLPVWLRPTTTSAPVKTILLILVILLVARRYQSATVIISLVHGAGLYLMLNVIGWAVGLQSPALALRTGGFEAGFFGFDQRVFFPLAQSGNATPALAGVYLTMLVALAVAGIRPAKINILFATSAVCVLVAAATRTPIVIALVTMGLLIWLRRPTLRIAPLIAGASLCLPFYYASIQDRLATVVGFVATNVPLLMRGSGASSDGSLNGRDGIWSATLNRWANDDTSGQFWGYGSQGQIASGAYREYGDFFQGYTSDVRFISPHGSVVQQLLDSGLVGVVLLLLGYGATLLVLARQSWRVGPVASVPVMGLLVLAGCSAVESFGAPGSLSELYALVLLAAAACTRQGTPKTPASPERETGAAGVGRQSLVTR